MLQILQDIIAAVVRSHGISSLQCA